MNKHKILSILFLMLVTGFTQIASAHPVEPDAALRNALYALGDFSDAAPASANDGSEGCMLLERTAATYVFAAPGGRFVVAAADDRLPSLVGYGTLTEGEMPPQLRALLTAAARRLTASEDVNRIYAPLVSQGEPVAPLIAAVRHQEDPFNRHCPRYQFADGTFHRNRCSVGCVATALETIVSNYKRTITLLDTLHGWTTEHYEIPDILPGPTIDTRLILDRYEEGKYTEEQADAVALLSYWFGVACHMNWMPGESGARVSNLVEPLKNVFGYGFVHHADSYQYSPEDWYAMLENEIRSARPVLYAGYIMQMGGHAFVLDGLDDKGFFHVNWGYGGNYDGYFRLDVLNAFEPEEDTTEEGQTAGFFCNQEALLLHPDAVEVQLPDTLERTGLEIAVDSITWEETPETGKYTPLLLHLRSTSARALTTPLEIFTNAPGDTALFEQADYVALTGYTLAAGEKRTVRVHATLSEAGERVVSVSPDDVLVLFSRPVTIAKGKNATPTFAAPRLSFPEPETLLVEQTIDNSASPGRLGHCVTYELIEGEYAHGMEGTRHVSYLYTPGGAVERDRKFFRALRAGQTYTLLVRCPWTIVAQQTFVMPDASGVSLPAVSEDEETLWFTLDGRRVERPRTSGVYLRRVGAKTEKLFIR